MTDLTPRQILDAIARGLEESGRRFDEPRSKARPARRPRRNLAALRSALVEGEQSGPATPFDFDDFIARKRTGE